jgi:RND family efflux transporter MFP subunit
MRIDRQDELRGRSVSETRDTVGNNNVELQAKKHTRRRWLAVALALAILAGALLWGLLPRVRAKARLRSETNEMVVPSVSVVYPKAEARQQEVTLPANARPYINAPIFARTNGYLRMWYTDIGTHVKKGQLLAVIETPELDQQLRQARENLATAQANLNLSRITADRYATLLKSDSVSTQERDNAIGTYKAYEATTEAAEANVRQLEDLKSYEKVYAPFDGVITARNTDIGALINSGSAGGPSAALFYEAQPDVLRVYVNVPEPYAQDAKVGLVADLSLAEYPGQVFHGKLVRTADAIDPVTRTLPIEIDVDNPTGQLLSGAFAEVHMKLPNEHASYIIPSNTLLFRSEGLRVATVQHDNKAALTAITLGRDFGTEVEVLAGLNENDRIIVDPPDSIVSGETVRIARAQQGAQGGAQGAGKGGAQGSVQPGAQTGAQDRGTGNSQLEKQGSDR